MGRRARKPQPPRGQGKGRSFAAENLCTWRRVGYAPVCISDKARGAARPGRIVVGGPFRWRGVHVRDIALLERKRRKLTKLDCHAELRKEFRRRKISPKFKSAAEAARIIIRLNDEWFGSYDPDSAVDLATGYLESYRPGRWKSPRKELLYGDPSRTGAKGADWFKIVRALMPKSREWKDVPKRLNMLWEEIDRVNNGVPPLNIPDGIYEIEEVERMWGDCDEVSRTMIEQLLERAVKGRLRGGRKVETFDLSDIPF